MALFMLGGGGGGPPFNRTFFNVALGDLLGHDGKEREQRLRLYLVDGTTLDVSDIDQVTDQYLVIRAYLEDSERGEKSLNVIPYGVIYRMEVFSGAGSEGRRLGFHWTGPARRGTPPRRLVRRAEGTLLSDRCEGDEVQATS